MVPRFPRRFVVDFAFAELADGTGLWDRLAEGRVEAFRSGFWGIGWRWGEEVVVGLREGFWVQEVVGLWVLGWEVFSVQGSLPVLRVRGGAKVEGYLGLCLGLGWGG